jgi:signal transduction histidine kinase
MARLKFTSPSSLVRHCTRTTHTHHRTHRAQAHGLISHDARITARADTEAELRVTDTGIGIPESELQHIGKRFHRITTEGGRSHEGTGIGKRLSLSLF